MVLLRVNQSGSATDVPTLTELPLTETKAEPNNSCVNSRNSQVLTPIMDELLSKSFKLAFLNCFSYQAEETKKMVGIMAATEMKERVNKK